MADGDHWGSASSVGDDPTSTPLYGEGDALSVDEQARYLDELVKDMRTLDMIQLAQPTALRRARALVAHEMECVRLQQLYATAPKTSRPTSAVEQLSSADGGGVTVERKIPMPEHPRCNLIGRILGPRGISVKQLEEETACHILVRGEGSVKDPRREARLRNYPGWEHLKEPLHVLVSATDASEERAERKLRRAVDAVKRLLTPVHNDEHKRRQLVQLAIINGTYRTDDPPLRPPSVLSHFGRM
uniref:K Homology domain-containing protein n=1 Tax=Plectus sambesii TaxID=2011161 RepID=A0A914WFG9_9BILA